jgi:hypothetical protein
MLEAQQASFVDEKLSVIDFASFNNQNYLTLLGPDVTPSGVHDNPLQASNKAQMDYLFDDADRLHIAPTSEIVPTKIIEESLDDGMWRASTSLAAGDFHDVLVQDVETRKFHDVFLPAPSDWPDAPEGSAGQLALDMSLTDTSTVAVSGWTPSLEGYKFQTKNHPLWRAPVTF